MIENGCGTDQDWSAIEGDICSVPATGGSAVEQIDSTHYQEHEEYCSRHMSGGMLRNPNNARPNFIARNSPSAGSIAGLTQRLECLRQKTVVSEIQPDGGV
jgi:hypothetical protein